MRSDIPRLLIVAGSDPSAGAGVQLDLKIATRLGVYGMTAVTAVTAQNSRGVQKINAVPRRIVAAQIDSVVMDIGVDACKIGMLFDAGIVDTVSERIRRREIPNVVLDPIVAATDGTPLLSMRAVKRLKRSLIPRCLVVTPNAPEAALLSGKPVNDLESLKEAAKVIHSMGCRYVLAKGGHLTGDAVDLLYDGEHFTELAGERAEGLRVHGTGCAFSTALAAGIARGMSVPDAAHAAKTFVAEAIRGAAALGRGSLFIII